MKQKRIIDGVPSGKVYFLNHCLPPADFQASYMFRISPTAKEKGLPDSNPFSNYNTIEVIR